MKLVIPLAPKTKKNSQQIIKCGAYYRIIPSKAYLRYEKECKPYIPRLLIDYPVNVKAIYYMDTHRRVDLCNLHEALCDVLAHYGCIVDDNSNIVATMDGSRVDYDHDNPRTEVIIERVEK